MVEALALDEDADLKLATRPDSILAPTIADLDPSVEPALATFKVQGSSRNTFYI